MSMKFVKQSTGPRRGTEVRMLGSVVENDEP